jgi:hypothetical protein
LFRAALAAFAVWELTEFAARSSCEKCLRAGEVASELQAAFDQDEVSFANSEKRLTHRSMTLYAPR